MNLRERTSEWLLGLYPAAWRDRFGDELRELLENRPPTIADLIDLLLAALHERWHQTRTTGEPLMSRQTLRWVGLLGPILHLTMVAAGLFLGLDEESSEALVLLSMTPYLLSIVPLHRLYEQAWPRMSRAATKTGAAGTLAWPVMFAVALALDGLRVPEQWQVAAMGAMLGFTQMTSVWLVLGGLVLLRAGRPAPFAGAAGLLAGLSWLWVFGVNLAVHSYAPHLVSNSAVYGIGLAVWLIADPLWAMVVAAAFVWPPPELALA